MCKEKSNTPACGCGHCHHAPAPHGAHAHPALWRDWMPLLLSSLLLLWGVTANPSGQWEWLIFVVAYLPVGLPIIKEAFGEIRQGEVFNEFTLMLIATAGAFAIGEYPEAVAVLLFYSAGEYFQSRAVGRARRDIRALAALRPDTATVIAPDGSARTLPPGEVAVGQTIEVKAGERVPLDGKLLTAHADFDTAALTGEPLPRTLRAGEEAGAGMIALGRVVRLQVVRPASESALQRILRLVEDASRHKAPAERFIRRFARIYTPVVLGLAALVALLPPLLAGQAWADGFYRALVFLVISCPCALVVSIPLGYFRGIGVASRKGILFKGSNYLDAITQVRAVVFDKTGTLTTGRFGVSRIAPAAPFDADTLLQTVAAVEAHSTHPIAQALVEKASGLPGGTACRAEHVEERAGLGLRAVVNGQEVLAGKALLLEQSGVALPEGIGDAAGSTCVYCAIGGVYAGVLTLDDRPRADAAEAVARLRALDVGRVSLLSGDRTAAVAALARKLGIGEFYGDLLPEGKALRLQRIQAEMPRGSVAFAGDGINDAPVLALSDVGIAMGGAGSDAAVETADVVISGDRPSLIADAVLIGRQTRRIVRLNIALALGVKLAVLLAGAWGLTGLWAAVLADTGVSLLCVANTYLIRSGASAARA